MNDLHSDIPFMERLQIEGRASDLLRSLGMAGELCDAFLIAARLKIPVRLVAFDDLEVAGKLDREGGRAEIQVKRDDPFGRQNFTVAHELGHYVLHPVRTWSDTTATMYRRSNWRDPANRHAEYQANLFAAALLMPEAVVKERWAVFKSPNYLAPIFRVSKKAVTRRLEELGAIVPSASGIRYLDLSCLTGRPGPPVPRPVVDRLGAIPKFPPVKLDGNGRIIPMSPEERQARSSAFMRVLDVASASKPEDLEDGINEGS